MSTLKKSVPAKAAEKSAVGAGKARQTKAAAAAADAEFAMPEPLYINDGKGKPAGVYLTVEQFERIRKELEDLADQVWALQAVLNPDPQPDPLPLAQFREQLKRAGKL